jgi:hypothetical protein
VQFAKVAHHLLHVLIVDAWRLENLLRTVVTGQVSLNTRFRPWRDEQIVGDAINQTRTSRESTRDRDR